MGFPVGPIVANLFMEDFEQKALSTYPEPAPCFWGGYVDDNTMVIIQSNAVGKFTAHINSNIPALNLPVKGRITPKEARWQSLTEVQCIIKKTLSLI